MEYSDRINEVYYGQLFSESDQHEARERIHWMCEKVEGQKVIDIGCSQGIVSILLARAGCEVVGVDIDDKAIEFANSEKAKEPPEVQQSLTFIRGSVFNIDLPVKGFHTAIMGEFLEHQVKPAKAIIRAHELLVDEGSLIITVPFGLLRDPDHKQTFYTGSLYKLVNPYFEVRQMETMGKYLCFLCKKREVVLDKEANNIELSFVEKSEREFQNRELTLTTDRDAKKRELNELQQVLSEERSELQSYLAEVHKLRSDPQSASQEVKRLRTELGTVKERLAEETSAKERALQDYYRTRDALEEVRGSISYQLGHAFIQSISKPGGNTVLLPYRVLRIMGLGFIRLRYKLTRRSRIAHLFIYIISEPRSSLSLLASRFVPALKRISVSQGQPTEPALEEQRELFWSFLERFKEEFVSKPGLPLIVISTGTKRIGEANRANRSMMFALRLAEAQFPVIYVYYRSKGEKAFAQYLGEPPLQMPNDLFHTWAGAIAAWDSPRAKLFLCSIPDVHSVSEVGLFKYNNWKVIYEVRDDWEEFRKEGVGKWYEREYERFLCRQADLVTTVSSTLRDKMISMGSDPGRTYLVPNGLTSSFLENARTSFERRRAGYRGSGIIGYFGHLTKSWFNWPLLLDVASRRPDLRFEIIGYGAPEDLKTTSNVLLLGEKTHSEIISRSAEWSLAIIPFKNCKLAEGVDPIKIYEYLALGLPCVSCWMPQIQHYPLTFTYKDDSEFEKSIDEALDFVPREEDWDRTENFVKESTWDKRIATTLSLVGIDDFGRQAAP